MVYFFGWLKIYFFWKKTNISLYAKKLNPKNKKLLSFLKSRAEYIFSKSYLTTRFTCTKLR
ncbi:hypothetical protein DB891_11375 [Flavobacterium laiguense]|uniref:Uncharacterized protein n=1 Tax=Flavobacterium laiguense TaxID=2169409 RepID=A0A2U1JTV4_9FLAO|nr:hypothetical protein DB891_11375 [Flavobacterium laiguense]